ncbi:HprK-related kinase A [Methylomarinum vadi]|uniref:HprK-related kinase A n=1 Tax=Methylomarinum vadi TaxID=438855 RepID=UPI001F3D4DE7|nr:HprK-related kinase A [Methylomarinum vadi]
MNIDPFVVRLESNISAVLQSVKLLYKSHQFQEYISPVFCDFHIKVDKVKNLRYFYKPQVQFYFDGVAPFKPLPFSQAYPFFEWGLNWCIANHTFQYLLIHAAVVEKDGQALIMPGQPGAGKSTLCAALVCTGWRLLSDEMAMIDMESKELIPIVRPVNLKNESISLIKTTFPKAEFGESFFDTLKGTVSHMRPPVDSVRNAAKRTVAKRIVFPRFDRSANAISLKSLSKGPTLLRVAENSFNYNVLGNQAFNALCDVIQDCRCDELIYSDLNKALEYFSK